MIAKRALVTWVTLLIVLLGQTAFGVSKTRVAEVEALSCCAHRCPAESTEHDARRCCHIYAPSDVQSLAAAKTSLPAPVPVISILAALVHSSAELRALPRVIHPPSGHPRPPLFLLERSLRL